MGFSVKGLKVQDQLILSRFKNCFHESPVESKYLHFCELQVVFCRNKNEGNFYWPKMQKLEWVCVDTRERENYSGKFEGWRETEPKLSWFDQVRSVWPPLPEKGALACEICLSSPRHSGCKIHKKQGGWIIYHIFHQFSILGSNKRLFNKLYDGSWPESSIYIAKIT